MIKIGEYKPDNLIAGTMHISTEQVVLSKGQIYPIGSVIALKNDGLGTLVNSGSDDAKTLYGILAEEVDATDDDVGAVIILSGEVNQNALVFGGTDTYETHKQKARELGIYFLDSVQLITE
ncbi:head decoration protein [Orbus mooreae]|uniref:head decoration protein n=1 Tax=Orbus mooreae TaxID=3074107 RepID=UPI00370D2312